MRPFYRHRSVVPVFDSIGRTHKRRGQCRKVLWWIIAWELEGLIVGLVKMKGLGYAKPVNQFQKFVLWSDRSVRPINV